MRPKADVTSLTKDAHALSSVTSNFQNRAFPPAASISDTRFGPSSTRMSAIATVAPSAAKSLAVSAPMPKAPPVTIAILFFKRSDIRFLLTGWQLARQRDADHHQLKEIHL